MHMPSAFQFSQSAQQDVTCVSTVLVKSEHASTLLVIREFSRRMSQNSLDFYLWRLFCWFIEGGGWQDRRPCPHILSVARGHQDL